MDKQSALNLIIKTFNQPFDAPRFKQFVRRLFYKLDETQARTWQNTDIPGVFKGDVKKYKRLGVYTGPEGTELDVLIINLKKETGLNRTAQRNFTAHYLKIGGHKEATVAAYYNEATPDWRFSLVRVGEQIRSGQAGGKIEDVRLPVRRCSFLAGPNEASHTAQQQLSPLLQNDPPHPTWQQLANAFNVEPAARAFFLKYRAFFLDLKEELDRLVAQDKRLEVELKDKQITTAGLAQKLLSQVVLLYFLQQKGWLGVGKGELWGRGPRDFMRRLFDKKLAPYTNFYHDILGPLCYEALDTERPDDFYEGLNCKIPFLDSGLFKPVGGCDWQNIALNNHLFRQIFETFDRYNFTIRENNPLEKEAAVDPEMLAKVFEELLAGGDRKARGVFYTPREIVFYMSQESLLNYLDIKAGRLAIPRRDIESFIRSYELARQDDNEWACQDDKVTNRTCQDDRPTKRGAYKLPETIRCQARFLDEVLASIKICDPAIGCGAFPVALMQEIVKARTALTPALPPEQGRTAYNFKRQAGQHSIYGVDIDPAAVDIARLRLWLSLAADKTDNETIPPLPHLDYKIVCGNALLGGEQNHLDAHLFEEAAALKPRYFEAGSLAEKKSLKRQTDDLPGQPANKNRAFDFETCFSQVFRRQGGFDVVIGNPPYVRVDDIDRNLKGYLKKNYHAARGKYDLYYLFFEKALQIMAAEGLCVFITPNKYSATVAGKNLRALILERVSFGEIISTSKLNVFGSAANYPVISIFGRSKNRWGLTVRTVKNLPQLNFSDGDCHYSLTREKHKLLPDDIIPINVNQAGVDFVIKILANCAKLGHYLTFAEALRIPRRMEREQKSDHLIVKQYQFERYGQIRPGSYISDEDLKTVSRPGARRYKAIFSPKILIGEDALRIRATLDFNFCVPQGGVYFAVNGQTDEQLIFWVGLLNSNLLSYVYKLLFGGMHIGGGYLRYRSTFLEKLPVPKAAIKEPELQKPLIALVNKILALTQTGDPVQTPQKKARLKEYEQQIDRLVYELYDLTPAEIELVEGAVS